MGGGGVGQDAVQLWVIFNDMPMVCIDLENCRSSSDYGFTTGRAVLEPNSLGVL